VDDDKARVHDLFRLQSYGLNVTESGPGSMVCVFSVARTTYRQLCHTCFHHSHPPPRPQQADAIAAKRPRAPYCDEKVANREIRVWHFVIENGY
jgi:hypothetical protein